MLGAVHGDSSTRSIDFLYSVKRLPVALSARYTGHARLDPVSVQLVWFKRDLRLHDHAPLAAAADRRGRGAVGSPREHTVRGGEQSAHATLASFLSSRGVDDRRAMSSPLSAFDSCSRIPAGAAGTAEPYVILTTAATSHVAW